MRFQDLPQDEQDEILSAIYDEHPLITRFQLRQRRWKHRRHRPDGTVGTQPPIYKRVARRRAAAKRARASRKANR